MPAHLTALLVSLIVSASAVAQANPWVRKDGLSAKMVEVEPGRFERVRRYVSTWEPRDGSFEAVHALGVEGRDFYHKDTTHLTLRGVHWVGVGVPICLRVFEGRLHLIVFDRDHGYERTRFRYFREKHGVLAEIEPKDFPKAIATQNLWLSEGEELDVARALDPADVRFRRSLTARVWLQLEKGTEYFEARDAEVEREVLDDYLRRHEVRRLKQIVPRLPTSGAKGGSKP